MRPMLGFTRCDPAVMTLTGIELACQIRKWQFDAVGSKTGR